MAKILSNSGIVTGQPVEAQHVSQSVNALTGAEAYDITISGSLSVTGPVTIDGLTNNAQINAVMYDPVTKKLHYTGSADIVVNNAQTASYVLNAISASYSTTASYVKNAITASYVLNAVSSSYAATASYVVNAITASYVVTAQTASYVITAQTASYVVTAQTASYVKNAQTASYVVTALTASFVTASNVYGPYGSNSILSSSYALTASYALNGGGTGTGFPFLGNATITGSLIVSGSGITVTGSLNAPNITGSLQGTSSWANNALTASYVQNAQTASYVLNAVSASYARTASYVVTAQTASFITASNVYGPFGSNSILSASYAATASFVKNAQTASYLAGSILQYGNAFGVDITIGSQENYNLNLITNNLYRVTIDQSGNVNIGDTSPSIVTITGSLKVKDMLNTNTRYLIDNNTTASLQWGADSNKTYALLTPYYLRKTISIDTQEQFSDFNANSFLYEGKVIEGTIDGSVTQFDLVYLRNNDIWSPLDQQSDTSTKMIGIYMGQNLVLLRGSVTIKDSNDGNTPYVDTPRDGYPVYLNKVSERTVMSTNAPTSRYLRLVGHCYYNNNSNSHFYILEFNPSNEWYDIL